MSQPEPASRPHLAQTEARRFVVATFNVHQCVGSDRRHDPHRIAAVIREIEADAIALQEVDSGEGAESGIDQFEFLANATGMQPIAGPTLRDHRGDYGNAILTRLPILATQNLDLSVPGREPRGVLDVTLDAGGHVLRLIATHLGLHWKERRKQVAGLVDLLGPASDETVVLLGDMNEWMPIGHSMGPLFRLLGMPPRCRTFPAIRPIFSLDRIWCRPSTALTGVEAHKTRLSRVASDHLPLKAELWLGGEAAEYDESGS